MEIDALKMAQEYARKTGKDTIREAGERNGYKYFHVFRWETRNHKIGIYHYVKIDSAGRIIEIYNVPEIMWAMRQEKILLNNG